MVNRDISRDTKGKYVYGSIVAGYRRYCDRYIVENSKLLGGEDILNGSMGVLCFKKFEIIENCYNKLIMNEL